MPWVAACLDLLASPVLNYCIAVRKLALQSGALQDPSSPSSSTTTTTGLIRQTNDIKMAPCAEEKHGESIFYFFYFKC